MPQEEQLLDALNALKNGDFSVRLPAELEAIAETFNTLMEQLNTLSSEVLRVVSELGPEGKLGGQAEVYNLSGKWADIVDTVNSTAYIQTLQVRQIAHAIHLLAN